VNSGQGKDVRKVGEIIEGKIRCQCTALVRSKNALPLAHSPQLRHDSAPKNRVRNVGELFEIESDVRIIHEEN
jgi:hypothetical protein